jgi:hypothetical protein
MPRLKIEVPFVTPEYELDAFLITINVENTDVLALNDVREIASRKIALFSKFPDPLDIEWGNWVSAKTNLGFFVPLWREAKRLDEFDDLVMIANHPAFGEMRLRISKIKEPELEPELESELE